MNIKKIIKEEIDDFDWVKNQKPVIKYNEDGDDLRLNTEEARKFFDEEKNGYYAISTPKGKDFPETILAYGSVPYIKGVLSHIDDSEINDDVDLYLGKIKYSKKDKDNVLELTKYY